MKNARIVLRFTIIWVLLVSLASAKDVVVGFATVTQMTVTTATYGPTRGEQLGAAMTNAVTTFGGGGCPANSTAPCVVTNCRETPQGQQCTSTVQQNVVAGNHEGPITEVTFLYEGQDVRCLIPNDRQPVGLSVGQRYTLTVRNKSQLYIVIDTKQAWPLYGPDHKSCTLPPTAVAAVPERKLQPPPTTAARDAGNPSPVAAVRSSNLPPTPETGAGDAGRPSPVAPVRGPDLPRPAAIFRTGDVYFYRRKVSFDSSANPTVRCDGNDLARLEKAQFFTVPLSPGEHRCRFIGSSSSKEELVLNIEPGVAYFVRYEGALSKKPVLVDRATADKDWKGLKAIEKGAIKNSTVTAKPLP
jgi:hypothetical protein